MSGVWGCNSGEGGGECVAKKFPNRKRMRARGPWWRYRGVGLGDYTGGVTEYVMGIHIGMPEGLSIRSAAAAW